MESDDEKKKTRGEKIMRKGSREDGEERRY
jgi:hypothetical protein